MNHNYTNQLLSLNKSETTKPPRVMVQIGQCSNSVGAQNILNLISASTASTDFVETGCDGLCFLAPKVIIEYPDKTTATFNQVSENDIAMIVAQINNSSNKTNDNNLARQLLNDQSRVAMDQCGYIDPSDAKTYVVSAS